MSYTISLNNAKEVKTAVFSATTNHISGKLSRGSQSADVKSMLSMLSLVGNKLPLPTSFQLNIEKGNETQFVKDLKAHNIQISNI